MTEHPVDPGVLNPAITLGLDTFGDVHTDSSGARLSDAQTIRNLVEEGVLAEQTNVDYFGIGEHHTQSFPLSAGDVVLAAIAARTSRIHLGSAVTVISSDDPVRVFQRYSTLDSLSYGRAEVILGRGSSTESFPLFGYDLRDYEELFEEKVNLFAELLKEKPVTWSGNSRAALHGQTVYPRTQSGHLSTWIGVGGSPESVVRAARYGFALMIAIIGGETARFAPFAGCSTGPWPSSASPSAPSACTRPGMLPPPMNARSKSSGPTTKPRSLKPPGCADSGPQRSRTSSGTSAPGEHSMSARPRPWPERSPRRSRHSGRAAST